jgi:hypothetical protein
MANNTMPKYAHQKTTQLKCIVKGCAMQGSQYCVQCYWRIMNPNLSVVCNDRTKDEVLLTSCLADHIKQFNATKVGQAQLILVENQRLIDERIKEMDAAKVAKEASIAVVSSSSHVAENDEVGGVLVEGTVG